MNSYTPHQSKYFAEQILLQRPQSSIDGLVSAMSGVKVDLNPHQVDAALFAVKSPLSTGALLADEVGLGKTILPLFAFDFTVWNEVVLFLVFFLVFAFLSIRHNHFSVNILLELMRYRFYSCELENEDGVSISKIVVCQEILSAQIGGLISARAINNEYIVKLSDKK